MNSDDLFDFGFMAVAFTIIMLAITYWAIYASNQPDAKTECEKNLPRDQHCVVQYVPELKPAK